MGVALWLVPGRKELCLRLESHMVLVQFLALTPVPRWGESWRLEMREGTPLRSLVVPTGNRHTLAWDSVSNIFFLLW